MASWLTRCALSLMLAVTANAAGAPSPPSGKIETTVTVTATSVTAEPPDTEERRILLRLQSGATCLDNPLNETIEVRQLLGGCVHPHLTTTTTLPPFPFPPGAPPGGPPPGPPGSPDAQSTGPVIKNYRSCSNYTALDRIRVAQRSWASHRRAAWLMKYMLEAFVGQPVDLVTNLSSVSYPDPEADILENRIDVDPEAWLWSWTQDSLGGGVDLGIMGSTGQPGLYASPALANVLNRSELARWYRVLNTSLVLDELSSHPMDLATKAASYGLTYTPPRATWEPLHCQTGTVTCHVIVAVYPLPAGNFRMEDLIARRGLPFRVQYIEETNALLHRMWGLPSEKFLLVATETTWAPADMMDRDMPWVPSSESGWRFQFGSAVERGMSEPPTALEVGSSRNDAMDWQWTFTHKVASNRVAFNALSALVAMTKLKIADDQIWAAERNGDRTLPDSSHEDILNDRARLTACKLLLDVEASLARTLLDCASRSVPGASWPSPSSPQFWQDTCRVDAHCHPGHFIAQQNNLKSCQACSVGSFCPDGFNETRCEDVKTKSTTRGAGAAREDQCFCSPGHYFEAGLDCVMCGHGGTEPSSPSMYKSTISDGRCSQTCPTYSETRIFNATSLANCECEPNYYLRKVKEWECASCPLGAHCHGRLVPSSSSTQVTDLVMSTNTLPRALFDPRRSPQLDDQDTALLKDVWKSHMPPASLPGWYGFNLEVPDNYTMQFNPIFQRCQTLNACLGDNQCKAGTTGDLCQICGANHVRVWGGPVDCEKCWSDNQIYLILVEVAIYILLAIVYMGIARLVSFAATDKMVLTPIVLLKIVCPYLFAINMLVEDSGLLDMLLAEGANIATAYKILLHLMIVFRYIATNLQNFGFTHRSFCVIDKLWEHGSSEFFARRLVSEDPAARDRQAVMVHLCGSLLFPVVFPFWTLCVCYIVHLCSKRCRSNRDEANKMRQKIEAIDQILVNISRKDENIPFAKHALIFFRERLEHKTRLFWLWRPGLSTWLSAHIPAEDDRGQDDGLDERKAREPCALKSAIANIVSIFMPFWFLTYFGTLRTAMLAAGKYQSVTNVVTGREESRLYIAPELTRFEGEHLSIFIVGMAGYFFYAVGLMSVSYCIVRFGNSNLCFGFNWNGYTHSGGALSIHWDLCILSRLALLTLVVFLGHSAEMVALIILVIEMLLQSYVQPFDGRRKNILNNLEMCALVALALSLPVLMILKKHTLDSDGVLSIAFPIVFVCIQLFFGLFAFAILLREFRDAVHFVRAKWHYAKELLEHREKHAQETNKKEDDFKKAMLKASTVVDDSDQDDGNSEDSDDDDAGQELSVAQRGRKAMGHLKERLGRNRRLPAAVAEIWGFIAPENKDFFVYEDLEKATIVLPALLDMMGLKGQGALAGAWQDMLRLDPSSGGLTSRVSLKTFCAFMEARSKAGLPTEKATLHALFTYKGLKEECERRSMQAGGTAEQMAEQLQERINEESKYNKDTVAKMYDGAAGKKNIKDELQRRGYTGRLNTVGMKALVDRYLDTVRDGNMGLPANAKRLQKVLLFRSLNDALRSRNLRHTHNVKEVAPERINIIIQSVTERLISDIAAENKESGGIGESDFLDDISNPEVVFEEELRYARRERHSFWETDWWREHVRPIGEHLLYFVFLHGVFAIIVRVGHWIREHNPVESMFRWSRFLDEKTDDYGIRAYYKRVGTLGRRSKQEVGFQFWPEPDPGGIGFMKPQKEIHNEVAKAFASFIRCLMLRHKLEKMPLGLLNCFLHESQRWACRHKRNMKWRMLMKPTWRLLDRVIDAYLDTNVDLLPDLHVIDEKLQRWLNIDSSQEKMRPVTVRSLEYFALEAEFIETQDIVRMLEEASRYITRPQTEDRKVPDDEGVSYKCLPTGTKSFDGEEATDLLFRQETTSLSGQAVSSLMSRGSTESELGHGAIMQQLDIDDVDGPKWQGKEDVVLGQVGRESKARFMHTQDYNVRAFRAHSRELRESLHMPRLWNGGITLEAEARTGQSEAESADGAGQSGTKSGLNKSRTGAIVLVERNSARTASLPGTTSERAMGEMQFQRTGKPSPLSTWVQECRDTDVGPRSDVDDWEVTSPDAPWPLPWRVDRMGVLSRTQSFDSLILKSRFLDDRVRYALGMLGSRVALHVLDCIAAQHDILENHYEEWGTYLAEILTQAEICEKELMKDTGRFFKSSSSTSTGNRGLAVLGCMMSVVPSIGVQSGSELLQAFLERMAAAKEQGSWRSSGEAGFKSTATEWLASAVWERLANLTLRNTLHMNVPVLAPEQASFLEAYPPSRSFWFQDDRSRNDKDRRKLKHQGLDPSLRDLWPTKLAMQRQEALMQKAVGKIGASEAGALRLRDLLKAICDEKETVKDNTLTTLLEESSELAGSAPGDMIDADDWRMLLSCANGVDQASFQSEAHMAMEEWRQRMLDWAFSALTVELNKPGTCTCSTQRGTIYYTDLDEEAPAVKESESTPSGMGLQQIFRTLDSQQEGRISANKLRSAPQHVKEELKLLLRLDDPEEMFQALDKADLGYLDINDFTTNISEHVQSGRGIHDQMLAQDSLTDEKNAIMPMGQWLKVTITSASSLGDRTNMHPYCVCEAIGKLGSRFQTKLLQAPGETLLSTCDPVWNSEGRIINYEFADSLLFTVHDSNIFAWNAKIGEARLPSSQLASQLQGGGFFHGSLPIVGAPGATLRVKAVLVSADSGAAADLVQTKDLKGVMLDLDMQETAVENYWEQHPREKKRGNKDSDNNCWCRSGEHVFEIASMGSTEGDWYCILCKVHQGRPRGGRRLSCQMCCCDICEKCSALWAVSREVIEQARELFRKRSDHEANTENARNMMKFLHSTERTNPTALIDALTYIKGDCGIIADVDGRDVMGKDILLWAGSLFERRFNIDDKVQVRSREREEGFRARVVSRDTVRGILVLERDSGVKVERRDCDLTLVESSDALRATKARVTIFSALGLKPTSQGDTYDTHCTCRIVGEQVKVKTPTLKGTVEPEWNHEGEIDDFQLDDALVFTAWNTRSLGATNKAEMLGSATLAGTLLRNRTGTFQGELPLLVDGRPYGTRIKVRVELVTDVARGTAKNTNLEDDCTGHILAGLNCLRGGHKLKDTSLLASRGHLCRACNQKVTKNDKGYIQPQANGCGSCALCGDIFCSYCTAALRSTGVLAERILHYWKTGSIDDSTRLRMMTLLAEEPWGICEVLRAMSRKRPWERELHLRGGGVLVRDLSAWVDQRLATNAAQQGRPGKFTSSPFRSENSTRSSGGVQQKVKPAKSLSFSTGDEGSEERQSTRREVYLQNRGCGPDEPMKGVSTDRPAALEAAGSRSAAVKDSSCQVVLGANHARQRDQEARQLVASSKMQLRETIFLGTWRNNAGEFTITKSEQDSSLKIQEVLNDGARVEGFLRVTKDSHLEGRLISTTGEPQGSIRLRPGHEDAEIIVNARALSDTDWGPDEISRRVVFYQPADPDPQPSNAGSLQQVGLPVGQADPQPLDPKNTTSKPSGAFASGSQTGEAAATSPSEFFSSLALVSGMNKESFSVPRRAEGQGGFGPRASDDRSGLT